MPTKEINSLKICFRILSLFGEATPNLGADEISEAINVPKSSVYRYLNTLARESILEYDQAVRKYMLGLKIFELGAVVYHRLDLRKIAVPYIIELAKKTGETVYLSALHMHKAICIERVESGFPIRLSINRGESFPLHASATARVLMAFLSNEEQDKIITKGLKKITEYTITDPVKLRKNLKEIRKCGFAYSDQEMDLGARAVSAPIFNFLGKVVAGLSIAGPIYRFTYKKRAEFKDLVIDYSNKISFRLGYCSDYKDRQRANI
jgi:IclR family transcriptional regulator, KDG regulon repressor